MQVGYHLADFVDAMKKNMRGHSPTDRKRMERLVQEVRSAMCFKLPLDGILFKDNLELKNVPLDAEGFTRPPYPTVVLEFDFTFPNTIEHVVLILIDHPNTTTADGRKGGVYCIPTTTQHINKSWKIPTFGYLLPYDGYGTWTDQDGGGWVQNVGVDSPFLPDAMKDLATAHGKGNNVSDFMEEMFQDEITYYVRAYLHFCAALGMHEVSYTDIEPDAKLNKMRRARGKMPLFTYKVLTIGKKKPKSRRLGGTHASPRSHLRRGYFRTSRNGVRHWVQPCMVKGGTDGFVHKDYVVEGATDGCAA
jgi:hypothetical protein